MGQFPKMKNEHKCTIWILVCVFNLENKLLPWKKPSSKRNFAQTINKNHKFYPLSHNKSL